MTTKRDFSRRAFFKTATATAAAAVPVSGPSAAQRPDSEEPPRSSEKEPPRSSDPYVDASGNQWRQIVPPPPADVLPVMAGTPCCHTSSPPLTYKLPLPPELEQRATALFERSIAITGHDHCFDPADFADMEAGGITIRNLEILTDGLFWWGRTMYAVDAIEEGWVQRGKLAIAAVEKVAADSGGKIVIVRRVADIERVNESASWE